MQYTTVNQTDKNIRIRIIIFIGSTAVVFKKTCQIESLLKMIYSGNIYRWGFYLGSTVFVLKSWFTSQQPTNFQQKPAMFIKYVPKRSCLFIEI